MCLWKKDGSMQAMCFWDLPLRWMLMLMLMEGCIQVMHTHKHSSVYHTSCLVSFLSVEVCPCWRPFDESLCILWVILVPCLLFDICGFCFVVCSFQAVTLGLYNFALPEILLQKATQSCCIPFEPALFWKRTFDALKGCLHRSLTRFRKRASVDRLLNSVLQITEMMSHSMKCEVCQFQVLICAWLKVWISIVFY